MHSSPGERKVDLIHPKSIHRLVCYEMNLLKLNGTNQVKLGS
jgi:hypothetical protein